MEVNPCKKCGRPVSVHAEYCPYCGCVVDRRPFVPASSKSTPAVNRPAPAAGARGGDGEGAERGGLLEAF